MYVLLHDTFDPRPADVLGPWPVGNGRRLAQKTSQPIVLALHSLEILDNGGWPRFLPALRVIPVAQQEERQHVQCVNIGNEAWDSTPAGGSPRGWPHADAGPTTPEQEWSIS